jgi:Holliday junction resolvase RusA-like endonuclease
MAITLPTAPPSLNNAFVNVPGRGRVKSTAYRNWLSAARWTIAAQRPRRHEGPVTVTIDVQKPKGRSDVDNRAKAVLDALTGIAWRDDSQVQRVTIGWAPIEGVRITIEDAAS